MRSPLARYGFGLGTAAAALLAVRLLHPALDAGSYMVFIGAVAVTAAVGGLGPALLTTALAVAAIDFFFLAPIHSLTLIATTDVVLLAVLGGVALLVSWVTALLQRQWKRAEETALRAAGIADLFQRHAAELERDVDALHALRTPFRKPKEP